MSTTTMTELLKKQEEERKNFAGGVFMAWQPVKENEKNYLAPYNNQYENAPKEVQEKIDQEKEAFRSEWGSDGRLATLMEKQHEKEREKLVNQTKILDDLDKSRSKDKDRGR